MGIVARQSFYNIISVILAFAIGALNTVVFYPRAMGEELYGIVLILLAQSNILQPIFSYGVQHTVIKYFSATNSKREQDKLLLFSLLIPLLIIFPSALLFYGYYEEIALYLSTKNPEIGEFIYLIFVIAIATAYFEIFYNWARVQKQTTVGNFLKEVYQRVLISVLLGAYFFEWLDFSGFINALLVGYYLRLFIIMCYSLWLYRPKIHFEWPKNTRSLLTYSSLIFLSAFGASVIIDIDASMLGKLVEDKYVAYYRVAIFIAAIIEAPGRALKQILAPMVAEAINRNQAKELNALLKKSSTNLLLVAGLFFVLINANISELYDFIYFLNGKKGFALAIPVVFYISVTKLFTAFTGCTDNIITNSPYYYVVPFLSIGSAAAVVYLNLHFIEHLGFIGAAWATFLVITVFNLIKMGLVAKWYGITPMSRTTLYLVLLIIGTYFIFKSLQLPFNTFINLSLKSSLIALVYLFVCVRFGFSQTVNDFLSKGYKKIKVYFRVSRP